MAKKSGIEKKLVHCEVDLLWLEEGKIWVTEIEENRKFSCVSFCYLLELTWKFRTAHENDFPVFPSLHVVFESFLTFASRVHRYSTWFRGSFSIHPLTFIHRWKRLEYQMTFQSRQCHKWKIPQSVNKRKISLWVSQSKKREAENFFCQYLLNCLCKSFVRCE